MKQRTSFLTRCLALALALVLLVSNANLGIALQAFAAESNESASAGQLVANHYDLTEAEQNLLCSGYLAGDTVEYNVPSDSGLVTIDSDDKTISAKPYEGWRAITADIKVDGETKQTVTLDAAGEGKYTYSGNAFSAVVTYVLDVDVPEDTQTILLNAAANLKQGVANIEAVAAQSGNLYILEQAMPQLADFAKNGISTSLGVVGFKDQAVVDAILALDSQMTANNGKLNLSVMINESNASAKTGYLMTKGTAMQAEVVGMADKLAKISPALTAMVDDLDFALQFGLVTQETIDQLETLASITSNLNSGLVAPAADPWNAAHLGTDLVKADANYGKLDELVAALVKTTAAPATIDNPLRVASTEITANLAMFNVTVEVILNVVEDKEDSAELVEAGKVTKTLALAENASAEEVAKAVEDAGIVADALASWADVYVAEGYDVSYSELPGALTEDTTYTVIYNPVEFTVEYNYTTDAPTSVPYGYQLTLPVSDDEAQAFDYTVNGEAYAEGFVITVTGDTVIARSTGKAYVNTDLYTVIAANYGGNEAAQEILTSGALKNNVAISYREPEIGDPQLILTLEGSTLTAEPYASSYAGLNWNAYTYNGKPFNGATAVVCDQKNATVTYRLDLTNTSIDEVKAILALPQTLKDEAATQNATLLRLMGENNANYSNMGTLTEFNVGLLISAISGVKLNDDPAKNTALQTQFTEIFNKIKADCYDAKDTEDGAKNLTIYNLLTGYTNNGLIYYYQNSQAFIKEIATLSNYMTQLLAEDKANNLTKEDKIAGLEKVATAAGYGDYAEKIVKLEQVMAEVSRDLTAPNAMIDVNSKTLYKLIEAIESTKEVAVADEVGCAYITSNDLLVISDDQVKASVTVQLADDNGLITNKKLVNIKEPIDRGASYSAEDISNLKASIDAAINEILGENAKYYNCAITGGSLSDLEGEQTSNVEITYTYTPKTFSISIEGEEDQTVSINDMQIELPKHPTAGWEYRYTINGVSYGTADNYILTGVDLETLLDGGKLSISREEVNQADEKLEEETEKLGDDWEPVYNEKKELVGLIATKPVDDLDEIATDMVNMGYVMNMNGEDLVYDPDGDGPLGLKFSLQTMIDAMLNYDKFGSQMIIDLAKITPDDEKGVTVLETSLVLGEGNAARTIDFTLNLTDPNPMLKTAAGYMEKVKDYMTFESNEGELLFNLTLPEKVYEVYLTALLATGDVKINDVNAINTEIAAMFFGDYLEDILNSDATTATYTNTLQMLGIDKDLTGYEDYYQKAKSLLQGERVEWNSVKDDGVFDIYMAIMGSKDIDTLLVLAGFAVDNMYKNMIVEYSDTGKIEINSTVELTNSSKDFEALIIDPKQGGFDVEAVKDAAADLGNALAEPNQDNLMTDNVQTVVNSFKNKVDYTKNLVNSAGNIAGPAAIVLLSDIEGDLVLNHATVIDLNGQTINGSVVANGSVYIFDSSMGTAGKGNVTGTVSGNATIVGGTYTQDVSAFLPDGYAQKDGAVQNALYTIKEDANGNLTFIINTDVMNDESVDGYLPSVKALACDIALDLVMNHYYTTAALSADGNTIYSFDLNDFVGLYASESRKADLINEVLSFVDTEGTSNFINTVIADLLDFGAIEEAINSGESVAHYSLGYAAWDVKVEHITDGNYMTFGVVPNYENGKSYTVDLKFVGDNKAKLAKLAGILDEVVVEAKAEVMLKQPYYADKTLWIDGSASAMADIDLTVDQTYLEVLIVVLANGNPDQKDALISALNTDNMETLKDVFDTLTVKNVFDALKAVNRDTDLAAMAKNVGADVDFGKEGVLEKATHLVLCAAGKALEIAEITGWDSQMGSLDKDDDGVYTYSGSIKKNPDITRRGYTVDAIASVEASLSVHIFCLWGDANHDGVVNSKDATLVLQHRADTLNGAFCCTTRTDVNQDGKINSKDATLILQYRAGTIDKLPVETADEPEE